MARAAGVLAAVGLVGAAGCAGAPPVPTAWERDLATFDREIAAATAWAAAEPASWLREEHLADALATRARHRGSLDDFEAADAALERAFAAAAPGAGPWLAKARLDLSLHRFGAARAAAGRALDAVLVPDPVRGEALAVIGRAALEQGELDVARDALTRSAAAAASPLALANLAVLATAEGAPAEEAWVAAREACACPGSRFDGWVSLQQGLVWLDADQPARALPWFEDAAARYDGDWVFDEHRAEALAAVGRLEEADAVYVATLARVRDPEVLAARASVVARLGDPALADALIDEARAGFLDAMDRFPEAASGHAAEFFAAHGPPEAAAEAARIEATNRPRAAAVGSSL